MDAPWIIISILCVSAWESTSITNKGRPLLQEGILRNFRHVPGPSASVSTDWEVGLREAVNQALLRERYLDYNLRERLLEAPLLGRQDIVTPFGDIVILARGQLYITQGGGFIFVQDQYQNDCDACHNPRPRCRRSHCQVWRPEDNEHLVALWTVKRLRHRNHSNGHYYELEYIISPITPAISKFVTRNGNFDYGIPGHIFVVKNDKVAHNQADPDFVHDRRIPHHHIKPEIIVGVTADGEKHILHSYPGFYTSFPVHPTYHQNRYSTNDPREIELYKELIESLAAKTSSTQKAETGPYKFSLNGYTESTVNEVQSTKPSYDSIPATQHSTIIELSTKPLTSTTVQFPQTALQQNIITKPPVTPTNPTELNTQVNFPKVDTMNPRGDQIPEVTQPITTIHYFTPIGEEDLITDGVTEMKKITLGTITKKPEEESEELGSDFLFPDLDSTTPSKTTTFYKPTTITADVSNILEEPSSSSTQTTKEYQTITTRDKPKLPSTTSKTTTLKPTTASVTTATTRQRPSITKSRPTVTTTKFKVIGTTSQTPRTTFSSKTESFTPKTITNRITAKINTTTVKTTTEIPSTVKVKKTTTLKTTEVPSTTTVKTTTLKLRPTKTKQSNLTGFIASASSTTGANKITTYKPRFTKTTTPKLTTTTSTTVKFTTPDTTTVTAQASPTERTTRQQTTLPTSKTTQPQRPFIDLDYTLLEDISPTEPMTATSLNQETEPASFPTKTTFPSTTTRYTTITTTQIPEESSSGKVATTKAEDSNEISFIPSTNTASTVVTTPVFSTTVESIQTSTVAQENKIDTTIALQEEIRTTDRSTTGTTLPGSIKTTTIFSTEKYTDATESETSPISTTYKPDTTSTSESTTTLPTSRKPLPIVTKLKLSTITANDFLTENGNEKPSATRPSKTEFDEYDIFGSTKAQTKPTKASTIEDITESDLASELFGSRALKISETNTNVPKIIYSNFFQASTAQTPEYTTQTESYETTTSSKPLTSQSYATSISFKVNKRNETSSEAERINTTTSTMASDANATEATTVTTETAKPETKNSFDRLALQLVNHAKSIDYLNGNNNKTVRAKYKRRKTYIPKNRRANIRKQKS